jgi:hypothetical protein
VAAQFPPVWHGDVLHAYRHPQVPEEDLGAEQKEMKKTREVLVPIADVRIASGENPGNAYLDALFLQAISASEDTKGENGTDVTWTWTTTPSFVVRRW